jgi:hypothetical protein
MMLQDIFKLLNDYSCQQQSYTECHKPARPAACDIEDALPPAVGNINTAFSVFMC